MIKELIDKNSTRSNILMKGQAGYFSTTFKANTKAYVFNVSEVTSYALKKVKFKFDKQTNKLECWTDNKYYYGSKPFIISWVESNNYKKINV